MNDLNKRFESVDYMYKEKEWLIKNYGEEKLDKLFEALEKIEKDLRINQIDLKDAANLRYMLLLTPNKKR